MTTEPDLIGLYRHVLRSGDLDLARPMTRALLSHPRYRGRAQAELRWLPGLAEPHRSRPGRTVDELAAELGDPRRRPRADPPDTPG